MCELTYMLIFCLFKSFVPLLRLSGLLTFFSSLVIQENLINCANERLRNRIFLASVFLLHILGVELAIAEMACVSRNIRRTFHVPFRQLSARP